MQHEFVQLYTDLCVKLNNWCVNGELGGVEGKLFRQVLLGECQQAFEKYTSYQAEGCADHSGHIEQTLYKRHMQGTINFIAKLICNEILASKLILMICKDLL